MVTVAAITQTAVTSQDHSVARQWNEVLLNSIRQDFATPTIHARNLYHVSTAMYDAWVAFDAHAQGVITDEPYIEADDPVAAQREAISYAAYRIIRIRFAQSPGAANMIAATDALMTELGYNPANTGLVGPSPAAVGNRSAIAVIAHGLSDGSNQQGGYQAPWYAPVNPPMVVADPGTSGIIDPNRWQPLSLNVFVDQFGNPLPWSQQPFLTPHWGFVTPFGLTAADMHPKKPGVYLDPGPPAQFGGPDEWLWREAFVDVIDAGSLIDPDDDDWVDISPGVFGNNSLGADDGTGHPVNPVTGQPYAPNVVRRGDFTRVLSEFWADGPGTEAPPGHWNVVANDVADHPLHEHRIGGSGPIVSRLEWDIKMYLALNGALHDAAIACWGVKGHYDFVRPISAIRFMAELGQSSDPDSAAYHPGGLPLIDGLIELIDSQSAAPGERHYHLSAFVGELAIRTWPGAPANPDWEYSGAVWIRALNWVPYQLPTFVTPPFAGYTSGHSTFSRAGAEVLAQLTGSPFFPGGLGSYVIEPGALHFEYGPSETVELQWATYYDASDQSARSRVFGGIHPLLDDYPARIMGAAVGERAWIRALRYFGDPAPTPGDINGDGVIDLTDLLIALSVWGICADCDACPADLTGDCQVDLQDLLVILGAWGNAL